MAEEAKWVDQREKWYYEKVAREAIKGMETNGLTAFYVPTQEEACTKILEMIPQGASVGWGGSVSLFNMGILRTLMKSGKYDCRNPFRGGMPPAITREQMLEQMRDTLLVDVYIAAANAITLSGQIVMIDGTGNRAAAMLFGPKNVIIVAGANKIVSNYEMAVKRIRDYVAPMTARMLGFNPPCVEVGHCVPAKDGHCLSPERICHSTIVIDGQQDAGRTTVIIVGEEMGF